MILHPTPALEKYLTMTRVPDLIKSKLHLTRQVDELTRIARLAELSDYILYFVGYVAALGDGSLPLQLLLLHIMVMAEYGHVRIGIEEIHSTASSTWLILETASADDQAFMENLKQQFDIDYREVMQRNPAIFGQGDDYKPVIISEGAYLYLQKQYNLEQRFIFCLQGRLGLTAQDFRISRPRAEEILAEIDQENQPFKLNARQRQAVLTALTHNLLIISGGPGTGKTTTIVSMLRALLKASTSPQNILLAAPTGRAANRIMESIAQSLTNQSLSLEQLSGFPTSAATLHKLLAISAFSEGLPQYHPDNQLPADVLIVDEASMIDLKMMTWLFEAIPPTCKIILVGDKDQLPSVDTGALLADLIEGQEHRLAGMVVQLEESKRSVPQIIELSAAVNQGNANQFIEQLEQGTDAVVLLKSQQVIPSLILEQYPFKEISSLAVIPDAFVGDNFAAATAQQLDFLLGYFEKFAILTPTNSGELGTIALNQFCQKLAGISSELPYPGQPVMIVKNDYELGLYNGDKGVVVQWPDGLRAVFRTSQGFKSFSINQIKAFKTAYAQTIHKSQGSEYPTVLVLLSPQARRLLSREILYTAITRAKSTCYLFADQDTLCHTIGHKITRYSGISQFVQGGG